FLVDDDPVITEGFTYDRIGNRSQYALYTSWHGDSIMTWDYGYEAASDRLAAADDHDDPSEEFTSDATGRISTDNQRYTDWWDDPDNPVTVDDVRTYEYDPYARLTSISGDLVPTEASTYDARGMR